MATSLSQTLIRKLKTQHLTSSPCRFLVRHQSSQSGNNNNNPIVIIGDQQQQLDFETFTVQRIEDAIHGIIVKRSAPDWLPFRPGYSYWVPPRRDSYGIAELVHTFSNNLGHDELMSLTTSRGWPSSTLFDNGTAHGNTPPPLIYCFCVFLIPTNYPHILNSSFNFLLVHLYLFPRNQTPQMLLVLLTTWFQIILGKRALMTVLDNDHHVYQELLEQTMIKLRKYK